jgi:hypothetical protein
MKRFAGQHHLEPVELRRIVRPGNLQPGIGLEGRHREVEGRGRERAHVDRGPARLGYSFSDSLRQRGAGGPVVSPNRDHRRASHSIGSHTAEGPAERAGKLRRELAIDYAADIILSEDGLGDVHVT